MKKRFLLPVFFALLSLAVAGQPTFVKDSLDAFIRREMKTWQIPGLAIAIIKDGKPVVMKGYGVRELGKPDLVDENTLFMIGSNTKAFTGTALCLLESEKKLSIDDKVKKWLPDFKLYDPLATEQATIRDMLCHRSGMKTFQGDFTYWASNLTRKQVIETFGKIKPTYDFRTRYGYCNAGFLTAGEVIPAATGQSWEATVKEKILAPLQMNRSVALSAEFPATENRCAAHTIVGEKLVKIPHCQIDNLAPAGSIGSSVREIANWLQMQLDTGKFEGRQVFPKDVILKTWSGNTVVSSRKSSIFPMHFGMYTVGWTLHDYAGRQMIEHAGGVNGFVTQTCFVPEESLAMVIFTNNDSNALYQAMMYQILDAYLNQPYRDYSQMFWKFGEEDKRIAAETLKKDRAIIAKKPKPALDLATYAGAYENEVYGNAEIRLEKGKLNMYFSHHPALVGKLDSKGGNEFFCTYTDPTLGVHTLPFAVENGKVKSVSVKVNDFVEYDPYVFVKK
jgi:CubicO group peptidase (beta-lactamase class C family)